jgi:3-isopropylmalate dehydrogenase
MLESFGMLAEAKVIRTSVKKILEKGIGTPELSPKIIYSCSQIGDLIAHMISEQEKFSMRQEKMNDGISTII